MRLPKLTLPLLVFTPLLLAMTSGVAAQSLPRVAIVAAATTDSANCRFTGPQAKLTATGFFSAVDIFNTTQAIPTLSTLLSYDACICWTNSSAIDEVAWGDVMADYADLGRGVVIATFANSDTTPARRLGGRWIDTAYEVIIPASGQTTGQATLGTVLDPGHPVMQGVTTFDGGGNSFRPTVTDIVPGCRVIAEWSDGRALVVEGQKPNRIDLGFYPPSSDCAANFWVSTTDGALLMANALVATAAAYSIPSSNTELLIRGDCNNDASFNLTDAVFLLNYLFPQGAPVALDCPDACDATDDGALNLPDAVALLNALFGMPPVPIAGPSTCDVDPTMDVLDCPDFASCP